MTDTSTVTPPEMTTVTLDRPIARADGTLHVIKVRRPRAGELRGLTMMALSQLDYAALEQLLPRITQPRLTKQEVAALDPADLMQLGGEVMDFLLPTAAKEEAKSRLSPEA